jgi:hypothetical protein
MGGPTQQRCFYTASTLLKTLGKMGKRVELTVPQQAMTKQNESLAKYCRNSVHPKEDILAQEDNNKCAPQKQDVIVVPFEHG